MLLIALPGTGFGCAKFPIITDRLDRKGQITGFRRHTDQPCPTAALPKLAPTPVHQKKHYLSLRLSHQNSMLNFALMYYLHIAVSTHLNVQFDKFE